MVDVWEKPQSRRGVRGESASFVFCAEGTDDPTAATAAVLAVVPTVFEGLVLQRLTYDEAGDLLFEITVPYGKAQKKQPRETGVVSREFQIGLESAHIVLSRGTIDKYAPAGETAPEQHRKIGVQDDGTCEGVDVQVPTYGFSVTIRPDNSAVTQAYRVLAGYLVGMVNLSEFEGYQPGEVLFAGAGGGERNEDDSEIRLDFLVRRNQTGITIGSITGIDKDGWDYLWVMYEKKEQTDGGTKRTIRTPVAAYVEEIFPRGDLTALYI